MCFKKIVLVSVLLLTSTLIQMSEAIFAKVGEYPEYLKYGLNSPECGFRNIAQNLTITRSDKCFTETVGNITWNDQENAFPNWVPNTEIENGEAPWIVSIKVELKEELSLQNPLFNRPALPTGHCAGVLITLRWVLTAAHCFKGAERLILSAGSNTEYGGECERECTFESGVQIRKALSFQDFIIPAKDKDKKENDFGLIWLVNPFKRHTHNQRYLVNTICLPEKDVLNRKSEEFIFFGFKTSSDNTYTLQNGQASFPPSLTQFPKRPCIEQMFCNNEPLEPKICLTDTGGPAVQYIDKRSRAVLIGIATDETVCGPVVRSFRFVAIPLKVQWILDILNQFPVKVERFEVAILEV